MGSMGTPGGRGRTVMDKRICFTGHRPAKIAHAQDWITKQLIEAVDRAIKAGYTDFISGGALGVDQLAARIVTDCDQARLVIAEPFDREAFMGRWSHRQRESYYNLLRFASEVVTVEPGDYAAWKYQKRNEWMVDRSAAVIAVWDGSDGGTHNTVSYAMETGKPIYWIDPKQKETSWLMRGRNDEVFG